MSSNVLRGAPVSTTILEEVRAEIQKRHLSLGLDIILVGDHPASLVYVGKKQEAAARAGITCRIHHLPAKAPQQEIETLITEKNHDPACNGYILQLPLPDHVDLDRLIAIMDPGKDVDGFTATNGGGLLYRLPEHLPPATARAVLSLLDAYGQDVAGQHVVIVGRSRLIGLPLMADMIHRDATVTVCHTKTKDLQSHTSAADILVSGTGHPHLITPDMVKEGSILIDAGFHKTPEGKLFGDIHPDCFAKSRAHAPVPGGVGSVTVAELLRNVLRTSQFT